MLYDALKEKERIISSLSELPKYGNSKKDLFNKSIEISNEQFDYFEEELNKFIKNVSNLNVYRDLMKSNFEKNSFNLLEQAKKLISSDYTEEELNHMPENQFNQIVLLQKQRKQILSNIAKKYFLN